MGNDCMKEPGMTKEKEKGANMLKELCVLPTILPDCFNCLILACDSSKPLSFVGNWRSSASDASNDSMIRYRHNFRTFQHGMVHGFMTGLFLVLPAIGVSSLFEMKSWKYILIAAGYWIIPMILMGGIICQWG